MEKQRKEMILNEIQFWKEHQLLPAHYCDFLITLYQQGEAGTLHPEKAELQNRRKSPAQLIRHAGFILLALLLLAVSVFGTAAVTESGFVIVTVLVGNALLWLGVGRKFRLPYLSLSGAAALILIAINAISRLL
ncbi:hypothetical protein [Indiicoccus explosivorum]|uniref:hypothetical protein n=1 Tax=Indiicoccus explosivorum TaxID=1917864 RepID=UPI000B44BE41|nr:hypothetical protein [Indiicoccus explosivorum]